jgi:hypothetical protein
MLLLPSRSNTRTSLVATSKPRGTPLKVTVKRQRDKRGRGDVSGMAGGASQREVARTAGDLVGGDRAGAVPVHRADPGLDLVHLLLLDLAVVRRELQQGGSDGRGGEVSGERDR